MHQATFRAQHGCEGGAIAPMGGHHLAGGAMAQQARLSFEGLAQVCGCVHVCTLWFEADGKMMRVRVAPFDFLCYINLMRVLVVEDDKMLGEAIVTGLRQGGYSPDWVMNAADARLALPTHPYGAVLMDLGLPDGDGLELLKHWRQAKVATPILIMTARDQLTDKVRGLDLGADDYLVKPFDVQELYARLRAVARRQAEPSPNVLKCVGLSLDPATLHATAAGRTLVLSAREARLLQLFMQRPGHVLAKDWLADQLFRWGEEAESNAVEAQIYRLRQKVGKNTIRTVRGVGYKLEVQA